jgi:hypothetical protein
MLNVITRVAKSIWIALKKMRDAFTEAKMARAEWEVAQHLRMQGYKDLSEFQKEKLRYYQRANF